MFRVISGYDETIWYEDEHFENCQEFLNNCFDVADEKELFIEETN